MAKVGEYVLAKRPGGGGMMRIEIHGINGDDGLVMWRSRCKQHEGRMTVAAWDGVRNEQRDILDVDDATLQAENARLKDALRRCGYLTANLLRLRSIIMKMDLVMPGMSGQILPQTCRDMQEIRSVCEAETGDTFEDLPPL